MCIGKYLTVSLKVVFRFPHSQKSVLYMFIYSTQILKIVGMSSQSYATCVSVWIIGHCRSGRNTWWWSASPDRVEVPWHPKPSPLVTHRSPERPEGRDSGFDCLIDLLQTVRQGVPAKLGGGGSVSRRGGRGCGERRERGGRELERGAPPKHQHPSMRYAGRRTVFRIRGDMGEGVGRRKEKREREDGGRQKGDKGKKKTQSTPWSAPRSQEDNAGANPAHEPREHEKHKHTSVSVALIDTHLKKKKKNNNSKTKTKATNHSSRYL